MKINITEKNSNKMSVNVSFEIDCSGSMLDIEERLLKNLNIIGTAATEEVLKTFDTDGTPICIGNQVYTSKGKQYKMYQSPYGAIKVDRHIYQSHSGGKTYCPLEYDARIIFTSTPKFAKIISSKYTDNSVRSVQRDLEENHGRKISVSMIQDICDAVGVIATAKEEVWRYSIPKLDNEVAGISVGLDGTCMLMKGDGWREAMTGTISLYDKFGERMHTIYTAAPPEYGKQEFLKKFEREIKSIKKQYPDTFTLGLADGARDNWKFLEKHTDHQLIDFYHASEYVGKVGFILANKQKKDGWVDEQCHKLKCNKGAASRFLTLVTEKRSTTKTKSHQEILDRTISYFSNNNKSNRMQYYKFQDSVVPIGSGATEAACKVLVKERMCKSGMRWKTDGARIVLLTRSIRQTPGRWEQFWEKIERYGFNIAA